MILIRIGLIQYLMILNCFVIVVIFFQLVDTPTRPNLKFPEKSTLIDLVYTNVPHKYSSVSVFENDVSDHCVVAVARDTKLPKQNSRIITRRFMKYFNEQAFLHVLRG